MSFYHISLCLYSKERNRWFAARRISAIFDRSKCTWSCLWSLIPVNLWLFAIQLDLSSKGNFANKIIFIFKSCFFRRFCLLPWIVFNGYSSLFGHIGILLFIFKFNTFLFVNPWSLFLLSLLLFLQISVSNWVTTKLLLLRIGSLLVTNTCIRPSRI
jgi:hypothetical protein